MKPRPLRFRLNDGSDDNVISGSTLFWSRKLSGNEWRNPWLQGNDLESAAAAWGLRAMLASRLVDEATPVAKYLLQYYRPSDQYPDVVGSEH